MARLGWKSHFDEYLADNFSCACGKLCKKWLPTQFKSGFL